MMHDRVGIEENMEKYEVGEEIGSGSFCKVQKAVEKKLGQEVVVKTSLVLRENWEATMKEEVEILRKLRDSAPHPNLVRIREVFVEEKKLQVVEDYCSEGDLLHFIDRQPITEGAIRRIFYELIEGVEHLHRLGIIHRDIKLENVLIDGRGHPKLTDFNLSCFWSKKKLQTRACGSLMYCAPEMFLRVPYYGPEVDTWSLGVLLFTLLAKRFPFSEETKTEVFVRKVLRGCEGIEFPPDFPPLAKGLVEEMLVVNSLLRPSLSEIKKHPWLQLPKKKQSEERGEWRNENQQKEVKGFSTSNSSPLPSRAKEWMRNLMKIILV